MIVLVVRVASLDSCSLLDVQMFSDTVFTTTPLPPIPKQFKTDTEIIIDVAACRPGTIDGAQIFFGLKINCKPNASLLCEY